MTSATSPGADGHSEGWYPTPSLVFDPAIGRFSLGPTILHCVSTATALPDGRVFLTGFSCGPSTSGGLRAPGHTLGPTIEWAGV